MTTYHLAQVNIARMKTPLDDPAMADFLVRIDEINALADGHAGFVWRLPSATAGEAYLRPYADDQILFNLSVWESLDTLKTFVYQTSHVELLRHRRAWFEHLDGVAVALWWVPAGHVPGVDEAKKRLAHLDAHGPTQFAFGFNSALAPDPAYLAAFDWSIFEPCPA